MSRDETARPRRPEPAASRAPEEPGASIAAPRPGALELEAVWSDPAHVASVEVLIRELCTSGQNSELGELVWEHVSSGGKRLRARLALFSVIALGGPLAHAIPWAASCELLHNASLIHDDIQDGDVLRRSRPALWARHGVPQAINAGDLAIALSYLAIGAIPVSDALRWHVTLALSLAARGVVAGQAAELALPLGELTWERYERCVLGKTSALFSVPLEGGALIAGRSPAEAADLAAAFAPLGLLFQIQDDMLDLFGDNGRGLPGSDLASPGKVTAFVVEHLRLHPEDRGWLLGIVSSSRADTTRASIDLAIERFAAGGALAAVWERLDHVLLDLRRSEVLAREPALHALAQRFAAQALRPVAHARPGAG